MTDFNIKLYLKNKYKLRMRYKIFYFSISNKQIKKISYYLNICVILINVINVVLNFIIMNTLKLWEMKQILFIKIGKSKKRNF